jgi:hypothetical protein
VKINELIGHLLVVLLKEGDIEVVSAKDAEGNGYDTVRGADLVYICSDMETVFDNKEPDTSPVALIFL